MHINMYVCPFVVTECLADDLAAVKGDLCIDMCGHTHLNLARLGVYASALALPGCRYGVSTIALVCMNKCVCVRTRWLHHICALARKGVHKIWHLQMF